MIGERAKGSLASGATGTVRRGAVGVTANDAAYGTMGRTDAANDDSFSSAAQGFQVKGGPVFFWMVAGLALVKDVIDIIASFLDMLGVALTATALGAPVGIPLAFLSEVMDKVAGMFIDFTILGYFSYIGGAFAVRIVAISIGAIVDAVPIFDVLPITTVSFFAAYLLGRGASEMTKGQLIGKTAKLGKLAIKVGKYFV